VFHPSNFSYIDQMSIAHIINCSGVVVALSVEGMSGSEYLLNSLARTRQRGCISEIAAHNFCPLLLQVRQALRVSSHYTYRFA
jgi:hypothetical protein